MAAVWRAVDIETKAALAIKFVPPGATDYATEAWSTIQHPSVVPVIDRGRHQHIEFLVMPWIDGQGLDGWLQAAPSLRLRGAVFCQVAQGLEAAHAMQIVHGDFKPANVLVDDANQACIIDFCTDRGTGCGTPRYLAPERFDGRGPDPLSDQFSFCYALYEALYETSPFDSETHRIEGRIRHPSQDPLQLILPITQGLSPQPQQRHPSMAGLCTALEDVD
jgi:serine/threonine protein kinase